MIKTSLNFAAVFSISSTIAFILTYVLSSTLKAMKIVLYEPE